MHPAASPLSFEATVGGYRLQRVIGQGDVSVVHEAGHVTLPRRAAIKLLRSEVLGSPQASQRVLREGCVLESFAHPGVPRVFDCGVLADGRPWLALELVGGEPLASTFARVGALPEDSVFDLLAGMVDIVAAAHTAGIVHRAIGPARVLVGGGGSSGVRILGWGVARAGGANELGGDRRADVHAIGALAYQAATGAPPFVAVPPVARVLSQFHSSPPPVAALRPELPPEIAELIDAMVTADPSKRVTAPEAARVLGRVLRPYDDFEIVAEGTEPGRDPTSAPPPAAPPPPRPPRGSPSGPSAADRDWEALLALGAARRPSSGAVTEPRADRGETTTTPVQGA